MGPKLFLVHSFQPSFPQNQPFPQGVWWFSGKIRIPGFRIWGTPFQTPVATATATTATTATPVARARRWRPPTPFGRPPPSPPWAPASDAESARIAARAVGETSGQTPRGEKRFRGCPVKCPFSLTRSFFLLGRVPRV